MKYFCTDLTFYHGQTQIRPLSEVVWVPRIKKNFLWDRNNKYCSWFMLYDRESLDIDRGLQIMFLIQRHDSEKKLGAKGEVSKYLFTSLACPRRCFILTPWGKWNTFPCASSICFLCVTEFWIYYPECWTVHTRRSRCLPVPLHSTWSEKQRQRSWLSTQMNFLSDVSSRPRKMLALQEHFILQIETVEVSPHTSSNR